MAVRISKAARKFLDARKATKVVLRYLEVEAACMVGVAKDVQVLLGEPDDQTYIHEHHEGIDVFIDPKLKINSIVHIKKQGFWKFSSLYADGLRVPI